ncbi:hypothetical protein RUM43_001786 [Polyplax serrata]|uniref:Uncharacterized protein n=1 Tax=Polyplax serrata TaxID=468196 RepID=A0AAN8SFC4_POLSC
MQESAGSTWRDNLQPLHACSFVVTLVVVYLLQSARVIGGKSIRRKPSHLEGTVSGGSSEPRIDLPSIQNSTPDVSPAIRRKGSSRRSLKQTPRKSAAFLDVPTLGGGPLEGEDEDSYRLRSFSFTSKGESRPRTGP